MSKTKKVSIIIPIYNAGLYLEDCLDSIIKQKYSNFEVIMVDDGSIDNSLTICKKFCEKDNRYKVYSKQNTGVSDTRNFGLSKSCGEYIYFMDADDIIKIDTISTLVDLIHRDNTQLAMCSYDELIDEQNQQKFNFSNNIIIMDNLKAIEEVCLNPKIQGFCFTKLFIRSILLDMKFDSKIKICEDLLFCVEYLKHIKYVSYIDKNLYTYRQVSTSAMHSSFNVNKITIVHAYDKIIKELNQFSSNKIINNYIFEKQHEIVVYCSIFYIKLLLNNIRNRRKYINVLKSYYNTYKGYLIKNKLTLKQKICLSLFKLRIIFK